MRTIFNMGFSGEPWRASLNGPNLGHIPWGALISTVITAGVQTFSIIEARKMAKDAQDAREEAEAAAAAAKAAAEAEKAAAQRKLDEEKKQQLQAQQASATAAQGQILGIPKDYVLYGGLGLGALGLVALVASIVK